jgi:hypothetical protein
LIHKESARNSRRIVSHFHLQPCHMMPKPLYW